MENGTNCAPASSVVAPRTCDRQGSLRVTPLLITHTLEKLRKEESGRDEHE
jgi:hypothetical protein